MVEDFENSGYPVFQGASLPGRGIHKKKIIETQIHFNGEYCNIDLLYRTVHSAKQLCICGAVTKCCGSKPGTNPGETSQSRLESVRKTSPAIQIKQEDLKSLVDIRRLPHASGNRMLQKLKDFNSMPLIAKLNISVQRRKSTIRSRKEIIMLQLLLKMMDGENTHQCAKNTQRQDIGTIQGHTHQFMQNKKLVPS